MSAPYIPIFVADYLADTAHLSAAEHGAYLLLIMNYWQRQKPLPADDRKLARIARMSDTEWTDARSTLVEFFTEDDGEWRHKRVDREIEVAREKSTKAKASARASAQVRKAKAERSLSERSTDAELIGEERGEETPSSPDGEQGEMRVPRAPSVWPDDFREQFLEAYPRVAGSPEKVAAALELIRDEGAAALADLIAAARTYATSTEARFICNPDRWLRERRWRNEPAFKAQPPPAAPLTWVRRDSPEGLAWAEHELAKGNRMKFFESDPGTGEAARRLPSRWPPNHPQNTKAA